MTTELVRPPETPELMQDAAIRSMLNEVEAEEWDIDEKFLRDHRASKVMYTVMGLIEDSDPDTLKTAGREYVSELCRVRRTHMFHRHLAFERAWKEYYKA